MRIFLFLLLLTSHTLYGQYVKKANIKLPLQGSESTVEALEYEFRDPIDWIQFDTINKELLVFFRGGMPENGKIAKLSEEKNIIRWCFDRKIGYFSKVVGKYLITHAENPRIFQVSDMLSGKLLWSKKFFYPIAYIAKDSIVIGYYDRFLTSVKREMSQYLYALDLTSGAARWTVPVRISPGYYNCAFVNDSLLLYGNNGTNIINLNKRSKVYVEENTAILSNLSADIYDSSAFFNCWNGYYPELNAQSNYLFQGDTIFHAGLGDIRSYMPNGEMRWVYPISNIYGSERELTLADDRLILLDLGYIFDKMNRRSYVGDPGVRIYDKNTGELRAQYVFSGKKQLTDYIYGDSLLHVLTASSWMYTISLNPPFRIDSVKCNLSKRKKLLGIYQQDFVLKTGKGSFKHFSASDTTFLIFMNKGRSMLADSRLNPLETFDTKNVFFPGMGNYRDSVFIVRNGSRGIEFLNSKLVPRLSFFNNNFVKSNKEFLYFNNGHRLLRVRREDLKKAF